MICRPTGLLKMCIREVQIPLAKTLSHLKTPAHFMTHIPKCRLIAGFIISALTAGLIHDPVFAQASFGGWDDPLKIYAVNIVRTPPQAWPGYGIYLGNGLVLTAAHVAGHAIAGQPRVLIGEHLLEAKLVREGSFEKTDLTLLSIDVEHLPPGLGLRLLPVCTFPPRAGQSVVVVIPEAAVRSTILPPELLPADVRTRFPTVIADVAKTGNSGSGVFDTRTQCLMGIMSRKIQQSYVADKDGVKVRQMRDLAKYFVPAAEITAFISGR